MSDSQAPYQIKLKSSGTVIALSVFLVLAIAAVIFLTIKLLQRKKPTCPPLPTSPFVSIEINGSEVANTGVFPYITTQKVKNLQTYPQKNTKTFILSASSLPNGNCETQQNTFYLNPVKNSSPPSWNLIYTGSSFNDRDVGKILVATQTLWTNTTTNHTACGTYVSLGDPATVDTNTIVEVRPNTTADGIVTLEATVPSFPFSSSPNGCFKGPLKGYLGFQTVPNASDWEGGSGGVLSGTVLTILPTPSPASLTPALSPFEQC